MNFLIKLFKGMYHLFVSKKPKAAAKEPYCRYVPAPAGPAPSFNPNLSTEENRRIHLDWLYRSMNPPLLDKGPEVEVAVCSFDGGLDEGDQSLE